MVSQGVDEWMAVTGGLGFPECPRWHEGSLWFSDIAEGRALRLDAEGLLSVVHQGAPGLAGLGWMPDGSLLLVAGAQRQLLRIDAAGRCSVHAQLTPWISHAANDMVVDAEGRAYVGQWGFDYAAGEKRRGAPLLCVQPDGTVGVAAEDLVFANGMAITPDGRTLIVAETFARRLSAFRIDPRDGSLHERRVWAALERAAPDGICLDAEGAVWLASPPTRELLRVREHGELTHRIATPEQPLACMLGGIDGRTLFLLSSPLVEIDASGVRYTDWTGSRHLRAGRIDALRVSVPGAGRP